MASTKPPASLMMQEADANVSVGASAAFVPLSNPLQEKGGKPCVPSPAQLARRRPTLDLIRQLVVSDGKRTRRVVAAVCVAFAVSLAFLGVTIFAIQLTKDTKVDATADGGGGTLVASSVMGGDDSAGAAVGTAEAVAEIALGLYDVPDASLADIESVVVPLAGGGGAVAFAVVAAERDANGALTLHGADGRRAYVSPSGAVNYASPEAVRAASGALAAESDAMAPSNASLARLRADLEALSPSTLQAVAEAAGLLGGGAGVTDLGDGFVAAIAGNATLRRGAPAGSADEGAASHGGRRLLAASGATATVRATSGRSVFGGGATARTSGSECAAAHPELWFGYELDVPNLRIFVDPETWRSSSAQRWAHGMADVAHTAGTVRSFDYASQHDFIAAFALLFEEACSTLKADIAGTFQEHLRQCRSSSNDPMQCADPSPCVADGFAVDFVYDHREYCPSASFDLLVAPAGCGGEEVEESRVRGLLGEAALPEPVEPTIEPRRSLLGKKSKKAKKAKKKEFKAARDECGARATCLRQQYERYRRRTALGLGCYDLERMSGAQGACPPAIDWGMFGTPIDLYQCNNADGGEQLLASMFGV